MASAHRLAHLTPETKAQREALARELMGLGGDSLLAGCCMFPGAGEWLPASARRDFWEQWMAKDGAAPALAALCWMSLAVAKADFLREEFFWAWSRIDPQEQREAWSDRGALQKAWAAQRAECQAALGRWEAIVALEEAKPDALRCALQSQHRLNATAGKRLADAIAWIDRLDAWPSLGEAAWSLLREAFEAFPKPGRGVEEARRAGRALAWARLPGARTREDCAGREEEAALWVAKSRAHSPRNKPFAAVLGARALEVFVDPARFNAALGKEAGRSVAAWIHAEARRARVAEQEEALRAANAALGGEEAGSAKKRQRPPNPLGAWGGIASLGQMAISKKRAQFFWAELAGSRVFEDPEAASIGARLASSMPPREGLAWVSRWSLSAPKASGSATLPPGENEEKLWRHLWAEFARNCGRMAGDAAVWALAEKASRGVACEIAKKSIAQARANFSLKDHQELARHEALEIGEALLACEQDFAQGDEIEGEEAGGERPKDLPRAEPARPARARNRL